MSDIDLTQLYDDSKSLAEGAITIPGYKKGGWAVRAFTESGFVDPDKPIRDYSEQELADFLYKESVKVKMMDMNLTYEGLIPKVKKSFFSKDRGSMRPHIRAFVDRAATYIACPDCGGTRLSEAARSSVIGGISIADACAMQISDLAGWVRGLDEPAAAPLLEALGDTLESFVEIGLGYLSLDRPSGTLSGGEAQRTKMIRHLGSSLTDVTYVFDEPTAGLHAHDVQRMNGLLLRLRDKSNTVLVIEHKPEVIEVADHVVDLGPGAGVAGGEVTFEGTVEGLRASDTTTGRYFGHRASLKPSVRASSGMLEVRGAGTHNLRDVDVDIPLGVLVVVTGVAGAGKSSLIGGSVSGRDGVVTVDQSRIRGSRRSNPATYTGLLGPDPQGVRQGQRRQGGPVQRQLRGRLPELQGCGRHRLRDGDHGQRPRHVRGVRGQAVPERGTRLPPGRQGHQRGPGDAGHRSQGLLRRGRLQGPGGTCDPRPARPGRSRLPQHRPAADHPLRWRAPAPQAGDPHGRDGRDLRA